MLRKYSQREARRLDKLVVFLQHQQEERLSRWRMDYPGGVHLVTCGLSEESKGRLFGAQSMGACLVAKLNGPELRVFAVRP